MANSEEIQTELLNYFVSECGLDASEVQSETPLFSSGLLDSLEVVKLLNFCEEKFNLKISPLEVSIDAFDSVSRITQFVQSKA